MRTASSEMSSGTGLALLGGVQLPELFNLGAEGFEAALLIGAQRF